MTQDKHRYLNTKLKHRLARLCYVEAGPSNQFHLQEFFRHDAHMPGSGGRRGSAKQDEQHQDIIRPLGRKKNAKDAGNLHSCMQCQKCTTTDEIESWNPNISTRLVAHTEGHRPEVKTLRLPD